MMNQTVYRILQLTIILVISAFIYMAISACNDLNVMHNVIDLIMYILSILGFIFLLLIMHRDNKRSEKQ